MDLLERLQAVGQYFVPASSAANLHALAQINYWTNVSFRIVLIIVVLYLLVESWQYLRRVVPVERLPFQDPIRHNKSYLNALVYALCRA